MGLNDMFKEDTFKDYLTQNELFAIMKTPKIIEGLKEFNIQIPLITVTTLRMKIKDMTSRKIIQVKEVNIKKLIKIDDIPIVFDYLIKSSKYAVNRTLFKSNQESIDHIISAIRKLIDQTKSLEHSDLVEKAKKGDIKSINKLQNKFNCKIYTKEEVKKYQKEFNKKEVS